MTVTQVAEVSPKYLAEAERIIESGEYKQTDIGVIPEDWKVFFVGDAFEICNNLRFPLSAKTREGMVGDYPYYGPTKIQDYINEYRVEGEFALIGEDGDHFLKFDSVPQTQYVTGRFNVNNHAHLVKGKIGTARWFYLFFRNRDISSHLTRQGAGRFKLNKASLEQILCAIPPEEEQTAIANALSDIDALISELEKLIAKKQAIKTATMQQLLTGSTRLPQFALREDGSPKGYKQSELGEIPEDWEVKTVYELVDYQKNLFDDGDWVEAEHITDKGIRLIQTGNIGVGRYVEKDTKKYIFKASFEKLKCKQLYEGDLLICRLAEPAGRACILPDIGESKVITSVDVTIFRPVPEVANREFYNQYFSSSDWFKSVLEQVGGTTHKRISRGALGKIAVLYPSLGEQTSIASILADMAEEIQALGQRLGKTRQIKQGMMQELLTGKTRLIPRG